MSIPLFDYHLNISDYIAARSPWSGILRYLRDRSAGDPASAELTDEALAKQLLKTAKEILTDTKEYDTFRKAISALRSNKTLSLRKDNLFRLLFVLQLPSDDEAHHFLIRYLHRNDLSPRALDEFIVLSALKLGLSWAETHELLYVRYADRIKGQENVPDNLEEGFTQAVYLNVIDRLQTAEELVRYLDNPVNTSFFAKTGNTLYRTIFFDAVPVNASGNDDASPHIRLVDDNGDDVAVEEYRRSLFGLSSYYSDDILSLEEIDALSAVFEDVFMTESSFYKLVSRHNLSDVSSGTFLLSFLMRIDPEDDSSEYYVDFLDGSEDDNDFHRACDEWLLYYGFPYLNPECGNFEKLLLDVHRELLSQLPSHPDIDNATFYDAYLAALRHYLRELIRTLA
ncbi:MAG: hypothetical protein Q4B09_08985 [Lachnospiraceae bacterium]|nr:hypothetical protein [Lachnospiraceae bacterium]